MDSPAVPPEQVRAQVFAFRQAAVLSAPGICRVFWNSPSRILSAGTATKSRNSLPELEVFGRKAFISIRSRIRCDSPQWARVSGSANIAANNVVVNVDKMKGHGYEPDTVNDEVVRLQINVSFVQEPPGV